MIVDSSSMVLAPDFISVRGRTERLTIVMEGDKYKICCSSSFDSTSQIVNHPGKSAKAYESFSLPLTFISSYNLKVCFTLSIWAGNASGVALLNSISSKTRKSNIQFKLQLVLNDNVY